MQIEGLVHVVEETQEVGSNGFKKRLLVVETQEQYKQTIPIDFVQDKTNLLDQFKIGDNVKVSINLRGNEHNGRYYLNAQGWRVEGVTASEKANTPPAQSFEPAPNLSTNEPDDLPF